MRRSILNYLNSLFKKEEPPVAPSAPSEPLRMYMEPLEFQYGGSFPITPHENVSKYLHGGKYAPSFQVEGYEDFDTFYNDYLEGIMRGWSYEFPPESPLRLRIIRDRPPRNSQMGNPIPLNRLVIR